MNFLKKFGEVVLKIGQIVAGVAPLVPRDGATLQVISHDLEQIALIVQQVEVMGQVLGQPGPEKLKAASPLVAQIILRSSILARHRIADPTRFERGVAQVASGMADILSALEAKVETTDRVA